MKVEVLVATMHQTDYSLLKKMNIQTDAVVINQCVRNEMVEFEYEQNRIKWFSFNERGVGLNRNNALMRATGDILLFADDDVVYVDNYQFLIQEYYRKNPKADVVVFNFKVSRNGSEAKDIVKKDEKLGRRGIMRYGTYAITAKNEALTMKNINFHRRFGGGAKYSCGEDTLFLSDCLNKKLKIYACKETLGEVNHQESTWFKGYTEKYFFDKGVLYYCLNGKWAKFISLYHCVKHRKTYKEYGWVNAYKTMRMGIKTAKNGWNLDEQISENFNNKQ